MKVKHWVKRKLLQFIAFGCANPHVSNLPTGRLYGGKWKQFCNPGLNCYSCPAARFACPVGAMQAVSGSMDFKFSFYAAGMLLAFGVILGRAVCGWLCPFGLFQELLHKIPSPKAGLKKCFLWIKYVVLVVFVLLLPILATNYMGMGKPAFCQYICPAGTLEGGLLLLGTHPELRQTIGPLFGLKAGILIGVILGSIFIYRFFCRVLCPLGAIYGFMNRFSMCHLEVDPRRCVSCGACHKACRMEVDPVKKPDSMECIRCGDCVQACPKDAIYVGFRGKAGNKQSAAGNGRASLVKKRKENHV